MTMASTTKLVSLLCTVLVAASLGCGGAQPPPATAEKAAHTESAAEAPTIGRKILHKRDIAELPGKESVVYVAVLAPGAQAGKHTHPGPELAYVASGSVQIQGEGIAGSADEQSRTVSAGESFSTMAGKVHDLKNISDVPAKIIVFIILEKGAPIVTPVADGAPSK